MKLIYNLISSVAPIYVSTNHRLDLFPLIVGPNQRLSIMEHNLDVLLCQFLVLNLCIFFSLSLSLLPPHTSFFSQWFLFVYFECTYSFLFFLTCINQKMLSIKSYCHHNYLSYFYEQVDKLKVLSESLACSAAKAEKRISDHRYKSN